MGSSHSQNQSMRTSRQRPQASAAENNDAFTRVPVDDAEHHINISSKMVERLVEDGALQVGGAGEGAGRGAAPLPAENWHEHMYMERLEKMDEQHSEKYGLKIEDLRSLTRRVEMRMSKTVANEDPVCAHQYQMLLGCYESNDSGNAYRCAETVDAFAQCIREAGMARLRAAADEVQRQKADRQFTHVAHHNLRDGPPTLSAL